MDTQKQQAVDTGCVSSGLPETVSSGIPAVVSSGVVPEIMDIIGLDSMHTHMVKDGVLRFYGNHVPQIRPDIFIGQCKWASTDQGKLMSIEKASKPWGGEQFCACEFEIAANPIMEPHVAAQKKTLDPTFDVDKTLTDAAVTAVKNELKWRTDEFVAAGCTRIWRLFRQGTPEQPIVFPADGEWGTPKKSYLGKVSFVQVAIIGG